MYRRPGGGSIPRTLVLLMVAALAGSIVGCGDDADDDAGGDDVEYPTMPSRTSTR
jgi:hypothetical protein